MPGPLTLFLARHTPRAEEGANWSGMRLRIVAYLSRELPPLQFVTSVRCVAVRGNGVLIAHGRDGSFGLPGGRREGSETLDETLRSELLEEKGWTLEAALPLGFLHFHHLTPQPRDYSYPYPDFLQVVYTAQAVTHRPEAMVPDDYVDGSSFYPRDALPALVVSPTTRFLLNTVWRK